MESESDPLTRRAIDLFEKEPLKGNSEVHLHTPTKFGEDRSKDLGGDREQTDRQTNRQTDKRCSIYSMIPIATKCTSLPCIGLNQTIWGLTLTTGYVRQTFHSMLPLSTQQQWVERKTRNCSNVAIALSAENLLLSLQRRCVSSTRDVTV